jgi:hypothetical protein
VWHASAVAWIDEFAEALGVGALSPDERRHILDLAREVAHRTERVNAPLASYLVGRNAAERGAAAIKEAAQLAEDVLPPSGDGR